MDSTKEEEAGKTEEHSRSRSRPRRRSRVFSMCVVSICAGWSPSATLLPCVPRGQSLPPLCLPLHVHFTPSYSFQSRTPINYPIEPTRAPTAEELTQLQNAVTHAENAKNDSEQDPGLLSVALFLCGVVEDNLRWWDKSIPLYEEALDLAEQTHDPLSQLVLHNALGVAHYMAYLQLTSPKTDKPSGRLCDGNTGGGEAIIHLERAFSHNNWHAGISEVEGQGLFAAHYNCGLVCATMGDWPRAAAHFRRCLQLSVEATDIRGQALACGNLGRVCYNLPTCSAYLVTRFREKFLEGCTILKDSRSIAAASFLVGQIEVDNKHFSRADHLLREAISKWEPAMDGFVGDEDPYALLDCIQGAITPHQTCYPYPLSSRGASPTPRTPQASPPRTPRTPQASPPRTPRTPRTRPPIRQLTTLTSSPPHPQAPIPPKNETMTKEENK